MPTGQILVVSANKQQCILHRYHFHHTSLQNERRAMDFFLLPELDLMHIIHGKLYGQEAHYKVLVLRLTDRK